MTSYLNQNAFKKLPFALLSGAIFMFAGIGTSGNLNSAHAATIVDNTRYDNTRNNARRGFDTKVMKCSSRSRKYRECAMNTRNIERVTLYRVLNNRNCRNDNWGYRNGRIWVRNGCQAEFRISYRGDNYNRYDNRYNNNGDNNDRYDDQRYNNRRSNNNVRISKRGAINRCLNAAENRLIKKGFQGARLKKVSRARLDYDHYNIKLKVKAYGRRGGNKSIKANCQVSQRGIRLDLD